jgi:hypothetical protein
MCILDNCRHTIVCNVAWCYTTDEWFPWTLRQEEFLSPCWAGLHPPDIGAHEVVHHMLDFVFYKSGIPFLNHPDTLVSLLSRTAKVDLHKHVVVLMYNDLMLLFRLHFIC